ncbi:OmpA family protein [candidate division WOR-3 bacterium]|nr:OmpA family protein [candidate division WOR-3 bacterium]
MKIALSLFLLCVLFIGCPKKQVAEPVEEPIVEETPFEEIELPVEPVEPPKPDLVLNMIFFDFDKSDIRVDAADILQGNAEMLKIYPDIRVTIEGHCCEIGTAEYNLALGERRAKATRDYLLMLGLTPDRLSTVSYGEEKPLDPKNLELNRRAEFTVQ